jgi:hypothetical protein
MTAPGGHSVGQVITDVSCAGPRHNQRPQRQPTVLDARSITAVRIRSFFITRISNRVEHIPSHKAMVKQLYTTPNDVQIQPRGFFSTKVLQTSNWPCENGGFGVKMR